MNQIFERDWHTKVYAEVSKLSSNDLPKKLRLNPLSSVKEALDKDRAPLIILKPLVESQHTLKLLDYFEGSKALWVYRDYRDVASSYVKKFGNYSATNHLKTIVEMHPNSWRYENVSDEIRNIVLQYFAEGMDPHDAAALFWFVRNSLFFELNLVENPKVFLCKYEDLVFNPLEIMKNIYEFLGRDFPGSQIVSEVHTTSVRKGENISLSPEIDFLCMNLLKKFNKLNIVEGRL